MPFLQGGRVLQNVKDKADKSFPCRQVSFEDWYDPESMWPEGIFRKYIQPTLKRIWRSIECSSCPTEHKVQALENNAQLSFRFSRAP